MQTLIFPEPVKCRLALRKLLNPALRSHHHSLQNLVVHSQYHKPLARADDVCIILHLDSVSCQGLLHFKHDDVWNVHHDLADRKNDPMHLAAVASSGLERLETVEHTRRIGVATLSKGSVDVVETNGAMLSGFPKVGLGLVDEFGDGVGVLEAGPEGEDIRTGAVDKLRVVDLGVAARKQIVIEDVSPAAESSDEDGVSGLEN